MAPNNRTVIVDRGRIARPLPGRTVVPLPAPATSRPLVVAASLPPTWRALPKACLHSLNRGGTN